MTLEGFNLLYKFLSLLEPKIENYEKPFLMYIDKVYNIKGVGCVVSGSIKYGKVKVGDELLIGPFKNGEFKRVKVKSIEIHYLSIEEASEGYIVGIALKGINNNEVRRGMVLCDSMLDPKPIRSFVAEVYVLTHPTRISNGYEPVIHLNTIAEAAKIKLLDKEYLKVGEKGLVEFTFKYNCYFFEVGEKFVFREGRTKGIGIVRRVF